MHSTANLNPPKSQEYPDDLGVTLGILVAELNRGRQNPWTVATGYRILNEAGVPDRGILTPTEQRAAIVEAVYDWVNERFHYIEDPAGIPTIYGPVEKLADLDAIRNDRWGDCDEHIVLLGSLLLAMGVPVEIWLSGPRRTPSNATQPTHIWLMALAGPGRAIAVDTTLKNINMPIGTVPPGPGRNGRADHAYWRVQGVAA